MASRWLSDAFQMVYRGLRIIETGYSKNIICFSFISDFLYKFLIFLDINLARG
jgi:hypothetical protein